MAITIQNDFQVQDRVREGDCLGVPNKVDILRHSRDFEILTNTESPRISENLRELPGLVGLVGLVGPVGPTFAVVSAGEVKPPKARCNR